MPVAAGGAEVGDGRVSAQAAGRGRLAWAATHHGAQLGEQRALVAGCLLHVVSRRGHGVVERVTDGEGEVGQLGRGRLASLPGCVAGQAHCGRCRERSRVRRRGDEGAVAPAAGTAALRAWGGQGRCAPCRGLVAPRGIVPLSAAMARLASSGELICTMPTLQPPGRWAGTIMTLRGGKGSRRAGATNE